MDKKEYLGYVIYSNGTITDKDGNTIKIPKSKCLPYEGEDGKLHHKCAPLLVFEAFSGEKVKRSDMVLFHDNNKDNIALSNLYLVKRTDVLPKYSMFSRDDGKRIKNEWERSKLSCKELSKMFGCSISTIVKILKDEYKYCI